MTIKYKIRLAMTEPHSPKQNHLLAALPAEDYDRLSPDLELWFMSLGFTLHETYARVNWVYFPTTSIVTLSYILENGASPSVAMTGNEGLVGMCVVMGGDSAPTRAVVQCPGFAYRLRASVLKRELENGGQLQPLSLLYTQAMVTQVVQTAVCNRHHSLDQQLCRWLLMILDRLDGNELYMTHDLIASMLGVRREGITQAAGKLQMNNLIQYRRGHITVLDRPGLEKQACECYAVVKKEEDRLLITKDNTPIPLPTFRNAFAAALAPLAQVLNQYERVKNEVEKCAQELSSVNIVIKEKPLEDLQASDVEQALDKIEKIEEKVQECADNLTSVNKVLSEEISKQNIVNQFLFNAASDFSEHKS